jgi:predicted permease
MGWFRQLFSRRRRYDELSESIREHLDEKIADLMDRGMTPEQAENAARREFGNVTRIEERSREVWRWPRLEALWGDLKYAIRQLMKHPGFAATAIVTLALGIGANVVVFGVLDALLLSPLNVSSPQSLVNVVHREHNSHYQSYPDFLDYRDRNTTFSGMAAYDTTGAAITTGDTTTKNFGYIVSDNYFDLLGVHPVLGRFLHANDEHGTNSAPYIVLSNEFWRTRFGGDSAIIGKTVDVNQHPFTIIGVAAKDFHGSEILYWPDFWMPITSAPEIGYSANYLMNRASHNPWIIGRLKSGVTQEQATDDLKAISEQLTKQYPTADYGLTARLVKPGLMGDSWGDPIRGFLTGIMALAGLVLLAACANLGSVFAARATDRGRELAIRLAIGSSRWSILRGLLVEALLISLIGGLCGSCFATELLHGLSRWQPFADIPFHVLVRPDAKVYAAALMLSLVGGILFGLLPARLIWKTDAAQAMKSGVTAIPLFRRLALRDLLLCIQISLCTLLVTASFVALRGMLRSLHAPFGFQAQGVTLAETDLTMAGYRQDQFLPVQKRMLEAVAHLPGVSAAGMIDRTILGKGCCGGEGVFRAGTTDFRKEVFDAHNFAISPGYFEAAGTRLLSGRDLTWSDNANSPQVAIINATFAHMLFGNTPAVGEHFLLFRGTQPKEVIGVVEDGKYQSLTEDPQPAVFFPFTQEINNNGTVLVVRSPMPSNEIGSSLYHTLNSIDPNLPLTVHSWSDALDLVLFPAKAATGALGLMGLLAAMLAVTGIFGMASYSVSQRMKELGIRVALGANHLELITSALGRPLILLLSGSIIGLLLGGLASSLLAQIVYEATPRDPLVIGGVILTMTVLGLLATGMPARRAFRINPARLLREE